MLGIGHGRAEGAPRPGRKVLRMGTEGPDRARPGEHSTASARPETALRKSRRNRVGGSRQVRRSSPQALHARAPTRAACGRPRRRAARRRRPVHRCRRVCAAAVHNRRCDPARFDSGRSSAAVPFASRRAVSSALCGAPGQRPCRSAVAAARCRAPSPPRGAPPTPLSPRALQAVLNPRPRWFYSHPARVRPAWYRRRLSCRPRAHPARRPFPAS